MSCFQLHSLRAFVILTISLNPIYSPMLSLSLAYAASNVTCAQSASQIKALGEKELSLVGAIRKWDVTTVKALLDAGVDPNLEVNAKNAEGMTALMRATKKTVEVILRANAEINAVDNLGYTALMYAISDALADKAQALISRGADVNVKARNGATALKMATYSNFIPAIDMLRRAGATE